MTVIASYRRTPYGRLLGGLSSTSAIELGAHALRHALSEAGVEPHELDIVLAGHVLQAGAGQNPARQTAVAAGVPLGIPAMTLNAVCLSGLEAVSQAVRLIEAGEASVVACVGQESMSQAPHLIRNSRVGTKYGAMEVIDSMEYDGLTDAFGACSMGEATEEGNTERAISRAEQDHWAARSHQLAHESTPFHAGEIVPLTVRMGRKEVVVDSDEGIREDTTVESLAGLRPAFHPEGTITAGNASQISDGAACIIVMSDEESERRGVRPLARILSHAFVAGPDTALHSQPARAIQKALASLDRSVSDLHSVEINEAFASVVVQSVRDLGIDEERVNRHGGAIALGHPIGSSGTRIVGTLARILREAGAGSLGAAGICGGGGQGSAMIIEALD